MVYIMDWVQGEDCLFYKMFVTGLFSVVVGDKEPVVWWVGPMRSLACSRGRGY